MKTERRIWYEAHQKVNDSKWYRAYRGTTEADVRAMVMEAKIAQPSLLPEIVNLGNSVIRFRILKYDAMVTFIEDETDGGAI